MLWPHKLNVLLPCQMKFELLPTMIFGYLVLSDQEWSGFCLISLGFLIHYPEVLSADVFGDGELDLRRRIHDFLSSKNCEHEF